ncbi:MAG: LysM peptidoglycan-binding domain-containing protein [Tenericutes bacterium]|nr:LysM peptidoglycan-binding domain-containing protein [Mycoplasmatota bacterium]
MYEIYTIQNGDTIEIIAQKLGIDPTILYQINGLTPNYVPSAGTNIIIPQRRNNNFSYYTIKKGDNLYTIAKNYNIDVNTLAKLNGLNISDYIYPNQTILVPNSGTKLYFVKDNETLNDVARNLNTTVMNILRQNDKIFLTQDQLIVYKEN